jgi:fatty acid desaturase
MAFHEGNLSAPALVLCSMFATSILHEMEHDIIHSLWARPHLWLQHVLFAGIWLAKLGANPWFRRKLHLQHHTLSGQEDDAEERLIGLGLPMGLKRMAVTLHPMGPRKRTPRPRARSLAPHCWCADHPTSSLLFISPPP